MYYGGMIFAIVMFIVSVLIFIKLKIHKVVGDLTGITEKRAIKNLEQSSSGSKLNNSGKLSKQNGKSNNGAVSVTDLIKRTDKLIISEEELRNTEHITTKLESEETTVLNTVEKELGFDPNQTTVLSEAQAEPFFYLETDLMVINTNEVI